LASALCSQAALAASKAEHALKCKNASKEERITSWQEVLQQLMSSFAVVRERIKRQEAESVLQHLKLVDTAKLQALKAFDQKGLLALLAETGVLELFEAQAAYKVGLKCLAACYRPQSTRPVRKLPVLVHACQTCNSWQHCRSWKHCLRCSAYNAPFGLQTTLTAPCRGTGMHS
jgi:hypothetical protein